MLTKLIAMLLLTCSVAFSQLQISSNQRYFKTPSGTPVLLNGSSSWELFGQISLTDAKRYIDTLAANGVNFVCVKAIRDVEVGGLANFYGVYPWVGTQTFASPINEPYWKHVDSVMDYLRSKDIYVWLYPDYLGNYAEEGLSTETTNSTPAEMKSWGEFISKRYRSYKNILWAIGGDKNPTPWKEKLDSMASGIKKYSSAPMAPRDDRSFTDYYWSGNTKMNFNYVYANLVEYGDMWLCASRTPSMIWIFAEGAYENESPKGHTTTTAELQRVMYWTTLWGGAGHIFGNCPLWSFDGLHGYASCLGLTWTDQLTSNGMKSLKYFGKVMRNRHWWTLVPDTNNVVLTAGQGTDGDDDYSICGYASDGTTIMVFVLHASRDITVTSAGLTGGLTHAWWYNPLTGETTDLGTQAKGSNVYTVGTDVPKLLVLDAVAANYPAPGLDTTVVYHSSMSQLQASSDQRYFKMSNGTPVLLNGVSAWDVFARCPDYHRFIDSLVSHNVNFICARIMSPDQTTDPNWENVNGDLPWTGSTPTTFAFTPNAPFWTHNDSVMQCLYEHKIYVQVFPDYLGYNNAQGFSDLTDGSSTAQMTAWGQWIGQRYGWYPNVLWGIGGDRDVTSPTDYRAKLNAMMNGIKEFSAAPMAPRDNGNSIDPAWTSYSNITVNYGYAYSQEYDYVKALAGRTPAKIFWWAEGSYENETTHVPGNVVPGYAYIQGQMYWTILWGGAGTIGGNCPLWNFGNFSQGTSCDGKTWTDQLNGQLMTSAKYFAKVMRNRHWWMMAPDTNNVILTAGQGTYYNADYSICGYATDGSTIMVFVTHDNRDITVTSAGLTGTNVHEWWYDGTTGVTTEINAPRAKGSYTYTVSGGVPKLLVLDAASLNYPAPGIDTTTTYRSVARVVRHVR